MEYIEGKNIYVIGVEIDETSKALNDEYFEHHFPSEQEDIALLMGNEANGILPKFQQVCSSLIRIPQYGDGTASLNVNVAASIVLHQFSTWKQSRIQHSNNEAATQEGK
jgi:tRNA G18 (ribose-2'-O)-methylase SpoU